MLFHVEHRVLPPSIPRWQGSHRLSIAQLFYFLNRFFDFLPGIARFFAKKDGFLFHMEHVLSYLEAEAVGMRTVYSI